MNEYALILKGIAKNVLLKSDTPNDLTDARDKLLAIGFTFAKPRQGEYQMIKVTPQDNYVIFEKPDGTTLVVITEADDFMTEQEMKRREKEGTLRSEIHKIKKRQREHVVRFLANR